MQAGWWQKKKSPKTKEKYKNKQKYKQKKHWEHRQEHEVHRRHSAENRTDKPTTTITTTTTTEAKERTEPAKGWGACGATLGTGQRSQGWCETGRRLPCKVPTAHLGFSILLKDTSTCSYSEPGFKPATFWLLHDQLYLLSSSRPCYHQSNCLESNEVLFLAAYVVVFLERQQ